MPQYRSLIRDNVLDTFVNHGNRDGIGLDIDWQRSDEPSSNELDLITDAILQLQRKLGGGIGIGTGLWDADRDTGIQVEETADDDIIRFDTAGVERATIGATGIFSFQEYLAHLGDADTYLRFTPDRLRVEVGGVDILDIIPGAVVWNEAEADIDFKIGANGIDAAFYIDGASGKVFLNDTTNAFALGPSLTIDGVGQDGEYLILQDSTDVAHGMTDRTETDTFGVLEKSEAAAGGLRITGLKDAGGVAGNATYIIGALGEDVDNTIGAGGLAVITLQASVKTVATYGSVNAGGNLVSIRNHGTNTALFNEDGDLYLDTAININAWDDYNDAELVRAGRLMMRSDDNPIKKQFMGIVDKYKDDLVKWKLINLNEDDPTHFMMGMKKWVMLNADCNWQNYERNLETRAIVDNHDKELIQLRKDKLQNQRAFEKISQKLGIPKMELLALGN